MDSNDFHPTVKPSGKASFFRYNISAILATAGDFLALIILTELLNVWYLLSTSIGALVGALTAFFLGRNWAFSAKQGKKSKQMFRYAIVATGSLLLNTFGVYMLTDLANIQYMISKSITALIVAFCFNYPLSKYYIFK